MAIIMVELNPGMSFVVVAIVVKSNLEKKFCSKSHCEKIMICIIWMNLIRIIIYIPYLYKVNKLFFQTISWYIFVKFMLCGLYYLN